MCVRGGLPALSLFGFLLFRGLFTAVVCAYGRFFLFYFFFGIVMEIYWRPRNFCRLIELSEFRLCADFRGISEWNGSCFIVIFVFLNREIFYYFKKYGIFTDVVVLY